LLLDTMLSIIKVVYQVTSFMCTQLSVIFPTNGFCVAMQLKLCEFMDQKHTNFV